MVFDRTEIDLLYMALRNSRLDLECEIANAELIHSHKRIEAVKPALKSIIAIIDQIEEKLLLARGLAIELDLTHEDSAAIMTLCVNKLLNEPFNFKQQKKAAAFKMAAVQLIQKIGLGYTNETIQEGIY